MVCGSSLRNLVIQAGRVRIPARGSLWFDITKQASLHEHTGPSYLYNCKLRKFWASVKMMVDTGATGGQSYMVNTVPEKEDDSGYTCGGSKSEDGKLSCGYSSFRGKRASMEDFYDVKMSRINGNTVCLFGIFDGHGGSRAAEYLKQHLFENLMKHPQFMVDPKFAISETYKKTDMDFLEAEKDTCRDDGSTASTAVLVGNHLYVANVGDSRAIVSKAGKAIPLSEDHKPNRQDERKRIESAGGVVMWAGTWRVGGVLAMSRAFGNRMLKQFVVAEPEIQEQEVNEELELLVLASDGLWDVVPNEDAVSIACAEEEPEAAARKLTEIAFNRGSADNITCIVVKFNHDKAELDRPQLEHHKGGELQQDQSKEAEHPKDATEEPVPKQDPDKNSEISENQTEESMILEDESKEPDALSDLSKEPGLQLDQVKFDGLNDPVTGTQLRHDKDKPAAIVSGEESLASV